MARIFNILPNKSKNSKKSIKWWKTRIRYPMCRDRLFISNTKAYTTRAIVTLNSMGVLLYACCQLWIGWLTPNQMHGRSLRTAIFILGCSRRFLQCRKPCRCSGNWETREHLRSITTKSESWWSSCSTRKSWRGSNLTRFLKWRRSISSCFRI